MGGGFRENNYRKLGRVESGKFGMSFRVYIFVKPSVAAAYNVELLAYDVVETRFVGALNVGQVTKGAAAALLRVTPRKGPNNGPLQFGVISMHMNNGGANEDKHKPDKVAEKSQKGFKEIVNAFEKIVEEMIKPMEKKHAGGPTSWEVAGDWNIRPFTDEHTLFKRLKKMNSNARFFSECARKLNSDVSDEKTVVKEKLQRGDGVGVVRQCLAESTNHFWKQIRWNEPSIASFNGPTYPIDPATGNYAEDTGQVPAYLDRIIRWEAKDPINEPGRWTDMSYRRLPPQQRTWSNRNVKFRGSDHCPVQKTLRFDWDEVRKIQVSPPSVKSKAQTQNDQIRKLANKTNIPVGELREMMPKAQPVVVY